MSTATITRSEALVIARGNAALSATDAWLAAHQDRHVPEVRKFQENLREALETYEGLKDGSRHPASEYPELARWWPHDAQGQALEAAAEDVRDDTGALVLVVGEHCAPEAGWFVQAAVNGAEYVNSEGGDGQ